MSRDLTTIQKELEKLEHDGIVLPESVVEFAKNPKTALHECFTWNDGEAAEKWRLEEARRLIRCYVIIEDAGSKKDVRAFVALRSDRSTGGGYRKLTKVLSDTELYAGLMEDAMIDLRAAQRKYARLKELRDVFREIDKVEVAFQRKQAKGGKPKKAA